MVVDVIRICLLRNGRINKIPLQKGIIIVSMTDKHPYIVPNGTTLHFYLNKERTITTAYL